MTEKGRLFQSYSDEIERSEAVVATVDERNLFIMFKGFIDSLADAFFAGGAIANARDKGKDAYIIYNSDDHEQGVSEWLERKP
jgi:hypothetical protein